MFTEGQAGPSVENVPGASTARATLAEWMSETEQQGHSEHTHGFWGYGTDLASPL